MNQPIVKLILSAVLLSLYTNAWPARYELQEGEQNELCRDYVAALNAAHQPLPMACERVFPPQFTKFSKPLWEKMDPRQQPMTFYRELYEIKHHIVANESDSDATWPQVRDMVIGPALAYGLIDVARAQVDIDGSGEAKPLVRIREHLGVGDCDPDNAAWYIEELGPPPSQFRYFVLDDDTGKPDLRYGTMPLAGIEHDLFYYQGRTYLDSFYGVSMKKKAAYRHAFPFIKEGDPEGYISVEEPAGVSPEQFDARQVCLVKVYYELERLPGNIVRDADGQHI